MNWIFPLVSAILSALATIFVRKPQEKEMEKNVNVRVQEAVEAGRKVDADIVSHPDSLRDDDGFKRPD